MADTGLQSNTPNLPFVCRFWVVLGASTGRPGPPGVALGAQKTADKWQTKACNLTARVCHLSAVFGWFLGPPQGVQGPPGVPFGAQKTADKWHKGLQSNSPSLPFVCRFWGGPWGLHRASRGLPGCPWVPKNRRQMADKGLQSGSPSLPFVCCFWVVLGAWVCPLGCREGFLYRGGGNPNLADTFLKLSTELVSKCIGIAFRFIRGDLSLVAWAGNEAGLCRDTGAPRSPS